MFIEGNDDYFNKVDPDLKYVKKTFLNICGERENLFDRIVDALKYVKYLVSELRNRLREGLTNNTTCNNTNKLDAINDLWKEMSKLSAAIKMNKEEPENLLVHFIKYRIQKLQKVYNSLKTDKEAGKLQAMEFLMLDLWDAVNVLLLEKNINKKDFHKNYGEIAKYFKCTSWCINGNKQSKRR